jgi:hypothetical protein
MEMEIFSFLVCLTIHFKDQSEGANYLFVLSVDTQPRQQDVIPGRVRVIQAHAVCTVGAGGSFYPDGESVMLTTNINLVYT